MKLLKYIGVFALFAGIAAIIYFSAERTDESDLPKVVFYTEPGEIVIEVDTVNAPVSAMNFLRYVDENRYTDASFYRVVTLNNQEHDSIIIEVIQGGIGFKESALRLPPISHESTRSTGLLHKNGAISMARSSPGSADSEIFICIGDQPELDFGGMRNPDGQGFAVFGRVIKGMEVVNTIHNQAETGQMLDNPVRIVKVKHLIR